MKGGEVGMTLEVVGALAIASIVWNIDNIVKVFLLVNEVCYLKGMVKCLALKDEQEGR